MTLWRCYHETMNADELQAEERSGFFVECRDARKASAFHEAGHCFAAFAMGERMQDVVVGVHYAAGNCGDVWARFDGYYGKWGKDTHKAPDVPRREIPYSPPVTGDFIFPFGLKLVPAIVSCAGPAAEWKFRAERSLPQQTKHTCASDFRALSDFAKIERNGSGADPDSYLETMWRVTHGILDERGPWSAVNTLACELVSGLFAMQPLTPKPGDRAEFVLSGDQAEAVLTRALFGKGRFSKKHEIELRARRFFLEIEALARATATNLAVAH
jgi:hypothetical protein